jgi:twitching motility protein PilT
MNFEQIINNAISERASDIHICPDYPVFVRKHASFGPINQEVVETRQVQDFLMSILSDTKKQELRDLRQTDFVYATQNGVRLRGNAFFEEKGISIAFRIIPYEIPAFNTLGFPAFVIDKLSHIRQGLVLVVGATGQGKSTTLASIMQERLTTQTEHAITIEDPIEYILPPGKGIIHQRSLGRDVGDFKQGIRAALREDPDVLLVGEMRDYETISAALTMAETGHIVFSTLHTNNGPETISRIIDVFPPEQQSQVRSQLAESLKMIIAQTLVPAINGGRALAYEILTSNYAIKNHIRQNKIFQIPNVLQSDSSGEMVELEQSLAGLVITNRITKEIALEYATDKEQLKAILTSNGVVM